MLILKDLESSQSLVLLLTWTNRR